MEKDEGVWSEEFKGFKCINMYFFSSDVKGKQVFFCIYNKT